MDEMVPKFEPVKLKAPVLVFAVGSVLFGLPTLAWLNRLKASARSCSFSRSYRAKSLNSEKFTFSKPGPFMSLRCRLPKVYCAGKAYAERSIQFVLLMRVAREHPKSEVGAEALWMASFVADVWMRDYKTAGEAMQMLHGNEERAETRLDPQSCRSWENASQWRDWKNGRKAYLFGDKLDAGDKPKVVGADEEFCERREQLCNEELSEGLEFEGVELT